MEDLQVIEEALRCGLDNATDAEEIGLTVRARHHLRAHREQYAELEAGLLRCVEAAQGSKGVEEGTVDAHVEQVEGELGMLRGRLAELEGENDELRAARSSVLDVLHEAGICPKGRLGKFQTIGGALSSFLAEAELWKVRADNAEAGFYDDTVDALRERVARLESLGEQKCPVEDGKPDPCPLCHAAVADGVCGAGNPLALEARKRVAELERQLEAERASR